MVSHSGQMPVIPHLMRNLPENKNRIAGGLRVKPAMTGCSPDCSVPTEDKNKYKLIIGTYLIYLFRISKPVSPS